MHSTDITGAQHSHTAQAVHNRIGCCCRAPRVFYVYTVVAGFTTEVSMGVADIYMMGHSPIGNAMESAGHS